MSSSPLPSSDGNDKPSDFTTEKCKRIMEEVNRLAGLAPGEWRIWIDASAERFHISRETLETLIDDTITANEKAAKEKAVADRRSSQMADRAQKAEDKKKERNEAKKQTAAEAKAEREQREVEKEAERKTKDKQKCFANMLKLPVDRHADEIAKLAKRSGEDAAALLQEFKEFAGVADGFSAPSDGDTELWPEPVNIAELLQAVDAKLSRYVVVQQHPRTAASLWASMAWIHNGVATHSPILTVTSAEPGAGKTELLTVLTRLVPKPSMNVETTGPSVYRFVDAHKPTLIIDEADDLFTRKSDLKHIINASWTRGATIPRQVNINGVSVTVRFDPFCPKALGLLGRNLPRTLKSRAIEIRMVPKRPDEKVEPFEHADDFEFAMLRRQLMRFATDNAATLKTAQPTFPAGMNNRAQANWKLLLAIAELAGGVWPQQAHEAAEQLNRSGRQPSDRVRLLAVLAASETFRKTGQITSEKVVAELCRNPLDIWVAYNKGGLITQRQVAALLDAFDIHPVSLHPTKRKDFSRQGYRLEQFTDAFARYLPEDPIIQSPRPTKASPIRRERTQKRRWRK